MLLIIFPDAANNWYQEFTKQNYGEAKAMPNAVFEKAVDSWLTQKKSKSAQAAHAKELRKEEEMLDN